MLALLLIAVSGAMAQSYTITLPSVSNGSVSAKVNDASVTSAEAGATVSLVATPYAGYRLKTISGTYQGAPEETFQKGAAMREGTYFRLVASANNNAGWRFNTGSESTITITSKQEGTLIDKVELSITTGVSFNFNTISVSSGTKTINGNVITITGINNTTLTITGTGNAAQGCTVQSATITGTTEDKALTLTSTGDDNVKTFTMPSGNVTISAEFEPAPAPAAYTVTLKEGTDDATSWQGKAGEGAYQDLPLTGLEAGTAVTVKYNGTKKVKSVKAKKKAAAAPATITVTWNSTNVFNDSHEGDKLDNSSTTPLTYEGITISLSGTNSGFYPYFFGNVVLACFGNYGDSFTFTAPSGKKFTKIEIIDNSNVTFTAYGDWTKPADTKIVWRGTPASTVTLGGSNETSANALTSIVFTLKD